MKALSRVICFVAGKSGGHIIPCLTLAERYKAAEPSTTILFFSTTNALDAALLSHNKLVDYHQPLPFARRAYRGFLGLFYGAYDFLSSLFISVKTLRQHRPTKLISSGARVALAPAIAAWLLRIPIELWELNAIPGKAINFLAPLASEVVVCFASTKTFFCPAKCTVQPYPVRFAASTPLAEENKNQLHKKKILILGGSQGSEFLNKLVIDWLVHVPTDAKNCIITHQTGANHCAQYQNLYDVQQIPATVFAYHHQLDDYYRWADIVVCRAGAGTLFELIFFNKPCIVIPLETRYTNHQLDNASALAQEYPALITVMRQSAIQDNATIFFDTLARRLGE